MAERFLEDYQAFVAQGRTSGKEKKHAEAYQQLSRAIHLLETEELGNELPDKEVAEVYYLRGDAMLSMEGSDALTDTETFHQVIDDFDEAISLQPEEQFYRLQRGKLYLRQSFAEYATQASQDFEAILKQEPENWEAMRLLGEGYTKQGAYDKAIPLFSRILNKAPDLETLTLRGVAFFQQFPPDYPAALQDFSVALGLAPAEESLYLWKAQCLQELDRVPEAIEVYDELIELAPGKAGYYVDRGFLRSQTDMEAALSDYEAALQITPHPMALNNRAFYYKEKREYQLALQDVMKAIEVDPSFGIAYATAAEIYADVEDRENMYRYLKLALDFYYENPVDVMMEPAFAPFLHEARFQSLIEKKQERQEEGGEG
ncbi:MAG: tetratricopeptide repeat protein [Bacteroidota bacterium]